MLGLDASKSKSMYINVFYDLGFYSNYKDKNGRRMVSAPEYEIMAILDSLKENPIYRISISDEGAVQTDCYDLLENFAPELEKYYDTIDELPKWAQDKVAVLMLLDHKVVNKEVKNVGRRISRNIFWVYKGETNGDDPRGES